MTVDSELISTHSSTSVPYHGAPCAFVNVVFSTITCTVSPSAHTVVGIRLTTITSVNSNERIRFFMCDFSSYVKILKYDT